MRYRPPALLARFAVRRISPWIRTIQYNVIDYKIAARKPLRRIAMFHRQTAGIVLAMYLLNPQLSRP